MINRRTFLSGCLHAAATACLSRPAWAAESSDLIARVDAGITSAVKFLVAKQGDDGAWRSEVYGPFKDGPSLTSLIAATFSQLPEDEAASIAAERARRYLANFIASDGSLLPGRDEITYPVYTAACTLLAMRRGPWRESAAFAGWLTFLRERQLTEHLGWQRSDAAYGGWSYAPDRPQPVEGKPATPLAAPNLSATVFALEALRASGCDANDAAMNSALVFVERCQNWPAAFDQRNPRFDDGGFFFILDDPQRNKAGEAGNDLAGRTRYVSYGSTTADGLRALIACGQKADNPRVQAAKNWLCMSFSAEQHPGLYAASREHLRPAVYYYYCSSAAQAFQSAGGPAAWTRNLAQALLARQRDNGSWANPTVDVREDDPLLATSLAIQSLSVCEDTMKQDRIRK